MAVSSKSADYTDTAIKPLSCACVAIDGHAVQLRGVSLFFKITFLSGVLLSLARPHSCWSYLSGWLGQIPMHLAGTCFVVVNLWVFTPHFPDDGAPIEVRPLTPVTGAGMHAWRGWWQPQWAPDDCLCRPRCSGACTAHCAFHMTDNRSQCSSSMMTSSSFHLSMCGVESGAAAHARQMRQQALCLAHGDVATPDIYFSSCRKLLIFNATASPPPFPSPNV